MPGSSGGPLRARPCHEQLDDGRFLLPTLLGGDDDPLHGFVSFPGLIRVVTSNDPIDKEATQHMKGEKMLDKMKAKCTAVSIDAGGKQYIDGACALTDSDGDIVFSTFDTRDLDKSQPEMDCGTHIITGGTGKYAGITGREPFKCITKATPAGEPAGSFAIDIPHNTTWEIR